MPVKAILFDIDGTLVDSNDLHVRAWQQAFAEAGYAFDAATIHAQVGKGGDNLVPSLLPDAGPEVHEGIDEAHGRIFKRDYLPIVKPFPGARELLRHAAAAGQKVVLASSASAEELEHHLDVLEARHLVAATTSGDDVERSKPSPDIFARALKKSGAAPKEAVVVGDTPYDVAAAGKCGIPAVAVRSGGFSDEALCAHQPLAIYDDAAALLAEYGNSPLAR